MSRVTVRQLCELFRQIAEDKISGEALQELIENARKISLKKLFREVLDLARKAASEANKEGCVESYLAYLYASIANISREDGDFDAAIKRVAGFSSGDRTGAEAQIERARWERAIVAIDQRAKYFREAEEFAPFIEEAEAKAKTNSYEQCLSLLYLAQTIKEAIME